MSGRIFRFDDSAHRAADSLLPWFVNGTLDEDERAAVDRHLRECARCRRETELLREVQVHCVTALPAADAAAGFHELTRRIAGGRLRDTVADLRRRLLEPWRRAPGWMRWLITAELAGFVGLATLMTLPAGQPTAGYRTLGATARIGTPDTIAVMFAPGVAEADLRRIVRTASARIVDGPTTGNAYVLEVPAGRRAEALAAMRSDPAVVLAEPLSAQPDR